MTNRNFETPPGDTYTPDQALEMDVALYDQRMRAELEATATQGLLKNVVELKPVHDHEYSYRIDLYPSALAAEFTDLIGGHISSEETDSSGMVVVRLDKSNKFGALARYHEAKIFKAEWYDHEDDKEFAEEMVVEYQPYEDDSRFLVVVDTNQTENDGTYKIVGMSRMVDGANSNLKTVDDMQVVWGKSETEIMADIEKTACEWYEMPAMRRHFSGRKEFTWDISSLAVAATHRNTDNSVYGMLSHEMKDWALEEGIHTWTTIFVKHFFVLYTKWKQIPFRIIDNAEPKEHMGAISVPAVLHLHELGAMVDEAHPRAARAIGGYEDLVQGKNLHYTALKIVD